MTTQKNNHNYQLTTPVRGKIIIPKSDPRNTPKGLAKLEAKYGKGNVEVVSDSQYKQKSGLFQQNKFNTQKLTTESLALPIVAVPSQSIIFDPPTNITYSNPVVTADSAGNAVVQLTISYDAVPGMDYEVVPQTSKTPTGPAPVISSGPTVSGKTISVSWNSLPNTLSYVLQASGGSINETVLAPAPITGTTGSVTVTGSGTYIIQITGYNSIGISGPSTQSGPITVS